MLPRFRADYRTLIWAYLLFPGVIAASLWMPSLALPLVPLVLYCGFSVGVFCHNHNHCPTFAGRRMNRLHGSWLSAMYGYPTFAWIPTHNLNHHKFVNEPGDATITWRYSKRNTWWIAATYFFVSAYWQSEPIKAYIRDARRHDRPLFRQIVAQYAVVVVAHVGIMALAVALHGWATGALVYGLGLGLMSAFALWSMMFINYLQHVHCDPWSKYNHSRNFVGKLGNWLVFNNGLHTVHHQHASMHWSLLRAQHDRIAAKIHPELCQPSMVTFLFRTYVLGSFAARFGTQQIGRPAYEPPARQLEQLAA